MYFDGGCVCVVLFAVLFFSFFAQFWFYVRLRFFLLVFTHTKTVSPMVKAVNHVVGAPVESHVLLECIVEVFPKPLNGWYRNDGRYTMKTLMSTNFFFRSFLRVGFGACLSIVESLLFGSFFLFVVSMSFL